ncbi:MAG: nucleotidyltransferase domain-containing protein [Bdellovibrionota bacterium]
MSETAQAPAPRLPLDRAKIAAFCQKWKISELSLFGSVLREDFRPDSDVDVLIAFAPDADVSLFDMVEMQEELENIVHRKVDLLSKRGVERSPNWIRRKEILSTAVPFYAAG